MTLGIAACWGTWPYVISARMRPTRGQPFIGGRRASSGQREPQRAGPPTARQLEVLAWLVDGLSNKEIASLMGITPAGVKKHIEALMRRYGVTRRTALVRAAMKSSVDAPAIPLVALRFDFSPSARFDLTPQQCRVLELAADGLKDKEISQVTRISEQTVRLHFANIRQRLCATNRAQAVAIAIERGIIVRRRPT